MKENTQEKQELPELVKGIPTGKLAIAQRREIVEREYNKLLEKLGKKQGKKKHFVRNDFLNVDVEIIKRESFAKASNASVKKWQSTYAVTFLEQIIKKSVAKEGFPIYNPPKSKGMQERFGYCNTATLYFDFVDTEKEYLNFTIEIVFGIKHNGRHVQYAILEIDLAKKREDIEKRKSLIST